VQDHGHDVPYEHGEEIDAGQHLQNCTRARFQINEVAVAARKIANDLEHEDDQRDLHQQEQRIRQEAGVPLLERWQEADFADANQNLSRDSQNEQKRERPQ
jgi:hypothetical protein